MKRLILEILENNSRISVEDLAAMLGKTPEDIMEAMAEMEEENIICGYRYILLTGIRQTENMLQP